MRVWQEVYSAFEEALFEEGISDAAGERIWCIMLQALERKGIELDAGDLAENSSSLFRNIALSYYYESIGCPKDAKNGDTAIVDGVSYVFERDLWKVKDV